MKAEINKQGELEVFPENYTELYALEYLYKRKNWEPVYIINHRILNEHELVLSEAKIK